MPHDRFFVHSPLCNYKEQEFILDDESEFHHMKHVMKCQEGDLIELIDGMGSLATATVVEISKKSIKLDIEKVLTVQPSAYNLCVCLAATRPSHLEFALEKCTEIGATSFIIFKGDLSERVHFSDSSMKRMQLILQAAIKQSGRLFLPALSILSTLKEALKEAPKPLFFGDITPATPIQGYAKRHEAPSTTNPHHKERSASIFIGPEKGWSDREKQLLRTQFPQGALSLSDAVLRAETAAIIGCHMLKHEIA